MNIVYFDLETQRTANDVGGWDRKRDMGMSLGVTYSTNLNEYQVYPEKRVNDLVQQLLRAEVVVGFNIVNFDYEVLMGYTILDLPHQLRTLDLLLEFEKALTGNESNWKTSLKRPSAWARQVEVSTPSNGGAKGGSWKSPNIVASM